MEAGNERLFRVLGDVGSDLIATAEQKVFARKPWRQIIPVAACLLAVVGLSLAAAPRFLVQQPGSESSTAAPEAAVEETAPVKKQNAPADRITADQSETEEQTAESAEPVVSGQQLVFWETVYYVEAKYTPDEAAELLGSGLGTVESADQEGLVGANVYSKQNAETRADDKERPVPLEIFVELEDGYLYCLTYYLSDKPLMEWEAAYYRWHAGKLEELAELFVFGLERNPVLLEGYLDSSVTAGDFTAEQLLAFFKTTLEMEQRFGTRTEDLNRYLWAEETGYVIPAADIQRQLDRYLVGYVWQPEYLPGYDPTRKAVVLTDLSVGEAETDVVLRPELCQLHDEAQTLSLTVLQQNDQGFGICRTYHIGFRDDCFVYEQIDSVLWEE